MITSSIVSILIAPFLALFIFFSVSGNFLGVWFTYYIPFRRPWTWSFSQATVRASAFCILLILRKLELHFRCFAFKSKSTLHIYIEIYYRIIWSDSGSLNIERVHPPHVTVTRFPTASPMRSLPRKSKTFPSCTPCLLGNPRLELCSGRVLV